MMVGYAMSRRGVFISQRGSRNVKTVALHSNTMLETSRTMKPTHKICPKCKTSFECWKSNGNDWLCRSCNSKWFANWRRSARIRRMAGCGNSCSECQMTNDDHQRQFGSILYLTNGKLFCCRCLGKRTGKEGGLASNGTGAKRFWSNRRESIKALVLACESNDLERIGAALPRVQETFRDWLKSETFQKPVDMVG